MNRADAFPDALEPARYPANAIVNLRRTVQRNDHIVYVFRDFVRKALEQQPGGENRHANAAAAQKIGEREQVRMHQGLATCEHHPTDLQTLDGFDLRFELSQGELAMLGRLPDVAHHAAAVAAAMRLDEKHRQLLD